MKDLIAKEKRHRLMMDVAAELFSDHGLAGVSLEQVAERAHVARRTLYYHFHDKDGLFHDLCKPVLQSARRRMEEAARDSLPFPDDVIGICLGLWDEYGSRTRMLYHVDLDRMVDLAEMHEEVVAGFTGLFRKGDRSHRSMKPEEEARLVFGVFVPILETIDSNPERDVIFSRITKAMIFA